MVVQAFGNEVEIRVILLHTNRVNEDCIECCPKCKTLVSLMHLSVHVSSPTLEGQNCKVKQWFILINIMNI